MKTDWYSLPPLSVTWVPTEIQGDIGGIKVVEWGPGGIMTVLTRLHISDLAGPPARWKAIRIKIAAKGRPLL